MGRIIVIDGVSNAGKTTLCENVQKNVENAGIIPGASLFAKYHSSKYPQIPGIPKSIEQEKENQEFFFRLELDRLIAANEMAESGKDVFMDRGVFEILSVAYSFETIKGWSAIYQNAKELYRQFGEIVKRDGITLPSNYILLKADSSEIIRRNQLRQIERGRSLSQTDWIDEKLINRQIDFFNILLQKNSELISLIDTNNMTKKEVLDSLCDLLDLKIKGRGMEDD